VREVFETDFLTCWDYLDASLAAETTTSAAALPTLLEYNCKAEQKLDRNRTEADMVYGGYNIYAKLHAIKRPPTQSEKEKKKKKKKKKGENQGI
jgi:hypothetical protein